MLTANHQRQRTLALCADDFGLAPGIASGIIRLARAQRLSAISCITNAPHWQESAPLLQGLPASVELGLHINLTEGRPLSPHLAKVWPQLPGLRELLMRAHLRLLPYSELRSEIHTQLAAFREMTGRVPSYLDGHQHVHQLPGLRGIVLDMAQRLQPVPAVRNTSPQAGTGFAMKRWVIARTGGSALGRELTRRRMAHNPTLLGAYDFRATDYGALMRGWLARLPRDGALLFCHPGEVLEGDPPDAIAPARVRELAYLESDAFPQDLARESIRLGRVW